MQRNAHGTTVGKPYTPDFRFEARGAITWLMDGANSVLCFDPGLKRFGCGRLAPGGCEIFSRPGMVWGSYGWFYPYWGYQVSTPALVSFDSSTAGERAVFRLITEDRAKGIRSEWSMDVAYDHDLESYAYTVTTVGKFLGVTRTGDYNPMIWEYFDLFPQGLFDAKTGPDFFKDGRKVQFPGPRWGYIVYQRGADIGDHFAGAPTWIKVPLNRYVTSASGGIRVWRDGYLGLMASPAGNPMVQLLGDTAALTSVDQCNWFYDLHFFYDYVKVKAPPAQGFSATARFRIVSFSAARSALILAQAQLPGLSDTERAQKRYPRYEPSGVNSFETSIRLNEPDHSRIWQPFHHHIADYHPGTVRIDFNDTPENHCEWVSDCAHTGSGSLMVRTLKHGIAGWQTPLFDRPRVEPGKRYRLSVYIRTEDLEGAGATLGYFPGTEEKSYALSAKPAEALTARPLLSGTRITGTSDWTRVEIVTPPMEAGPRGRMFEYEFQNCLIQPVFWHEGRGVSWFDDFSLEAISP